VLRAELLSADHARVTFGLREHDVAVVLLDVEGTTTPITFVHDVLFPYARARLNAHLRSRAGEDELRGVLATLRVEWLEDAKAKLEPPPWALADLPAAARYLEWLMDRDRKSPGLKRLQGDIWRAGYRDGTLKGEVFPDVPPALKRWRAAGFDVAIYSSGSVAAQKMLFGTTAYGDLTSFLTGFFDTAVGPKVASDSYHRIASSSGWRPSQILFLSDAPLELEAARKAGCQALLTIRPGNQPANAGPASEIHSFDEIES
jgi:enolase-phosphatase E1